MVLGGIAILLLYIFLTHRNSSPSGEQDTTPAGASHAKAMLVVGILEIQSTKANGRDWDFGLGGQPDPVVTVINRTQRIRRQTRRISDTLKVEFSQRMGMVHEGDDVIVRVDDIDLHNDDLIGETQFQVTAEMLEKEQQELQFGQVKRLLLRFEKQK